MLVLAGGHAGDHVLLAATIHELVYFLLLSRGPQINVAAVGGDAEAPPHVGTLGVAETVMMVRAAVRGRDAVLLVDPRGQASLPICLRVETAIIVTCPGCPRRAELIL